MVTCALHARFNGLATALGVAEGLISVALGGRPVFSWRLYTNRQPTTGFQFINGLQDLVFRQVNEHSGSGLPWRYIPPAEMTDSPCWRRSSSTFL